jgi:hypothetical protein
VLLNWLTVPELHREMCKLNQSLGRQGHDFAVIFPFTSLKCTSEDHQGREEGNANLKVLLQMPTYFTQGQEVERVFAALFLLPSSLSCEQRRLVSCHDEIAAAMWGAVA